MRLKPGCRRNEAIGPPGDLYSPPYPVLRAPLGVPVYDKVLRFIHTPVNHWLGSHMVSYLPRPILVVYRGPHVPYIRVLSCCNRDFLPSASLGDLVLGRGRMTPLVYTLVGRRTNLRNVLWPLHFFALGT